VPLAAEMRAKPPVESINAPAIGAPVEQDVTVPVIVAVGAGVHCGNLNLPMRVDQPKLLVVW